MNRKPQDTALLSPDDALSEMDREGSAPSHAPAPISVSLSLAGALRAHKKGKLDKAVKIYSGILKKYPDHADANYLLGVAAFERGLKEDAIAMIERAIAAEPDNAAYYGKLGEIFTLIGYVERADDAYAKAAELAPGDVRFHLGRAQIMERNGEIEKARAQYLEIIEKWPSSAESHYRFAAIEARTGKRELARSHAAKALSLQEGYADAHFLYALLSLGQGESKKARAHFALASKHAAQKSDLHMKSAKKLMQIGDYETALTALYRQTRMKPNDYDAFSLMGNCLAAKKEHEAAMVSFERALEIKPDHLEALRAKTLSLLALHHVEDAFEMAQKAVQFHPEKWQSQMVLGLVYRENDQLMDAIDVLNKAVRLAPHEPDVSHVLAQTYQENLELNHALHYVREALSLAPKNKEIELTLARCSLQAGNWKDGWRHYEARQHKAGSRPPVMEDVPQWEGSPDPEGRLLVYMEGTKSDALQFSRFIPRLKNDFKDVYFYCDKDLARLFADLEGLSGVIPKDTPLPRVDKIIALGSLPSILGLEEQNQLEQGTPYLKPLERDVERWQSRLSQDARAKSVGLVWQGDTTFKGDKKRSPGIWPFSRLFYMRNIDFFGIQVGDGSDVLSDPQLAKVVRNYGIDLLDFADTAALISALDLVVTCDTSVAHLAGAMHKPVWMVVPYGMDWRWGIPKGLEAERTFWYPSMRIYRQAEPGDWADVFARIGLELDQLVNATS